MNFQPVLLQASAEILLIFSKLFDYELNCKLLSHFTLPFYFFFPSLLSFRFPSSHLSPPHSLSFFPSFYFNEIEHKICMVCFDNCEIFDYFEICKLWFIVCPRLRYVLFTTKPNSYVSGGNILLYYVNKLTKFDYTFINHDVFMTYYK